MEVVVELVLVVHQLQVKDLQAVLEAIQLVAVLVAVAVELAL